MMAVLIMDYSFSSSWWGDPQVMDVGEILMLARMSRRAKTRSRENLLEKRDGELQQDQYLDSQWVCRRLW